MATSAMAPTRARVSPVLHTGAILAAALVLRIAATVLAFQRCSPAAQARANSEVLAIARSLAGGHGFSSPFVADSGPTAFLAPGYPLLIAALFRLFGVSAAAVVAVVALQILFSVLTVWLVMGLGRRQFGPLTAKIAGCICAFSLPLATEPFWIWETCLSSLLLVGLFAALLSARSRGQWAIAGAGTALATLVNPALLPTLALVGACQSWRRRILPWAGMVAFLALYAPWPVRNLLVMHAPVLLRSNFGYELWLGNHPGGDGEFHHELDPEENAQERSLFVAVGEQQYMRMKTAAALDFIRSHPSEFLTLTARRVGRFWGAEMEGPSWTAAAFSLLAFAGLGLAWRRPELRLYAVPLAIYPLPYYLTHADPRFRHLIDPLLALLAAYAISALARKLHLHAGDRPPDPAALERNA